MGMNSFIFGNINSANYGVWLTGSGTFSAPERDVEFVSVPGRNGDLIIDNGRWNNVEVTYPANIPNHFNDKFPAFRAAMCRQRGYQRLEDTYHKDEYRLAAFVDGLEPDMIPLNKGGEFDITFNCKPQRFLKAGDKPIQLMPTMSVATTAYSHLIPADPANSDITITIHCPDDDPILFSLDEVDENGDDTGGVSFTAHNGDTQTIQLDEGAVKWQIVISGFNDLDKINIEVKTSILYNGEPMALNAIFGRKFDFRNPTGYKTKPLIEVFESALSKFSISNYIGDVRDEYFDMNVSATGVSHFYIDCDLQYLYDNSRNNLTNKLSITTAESAIGEALVFPELGEELISIYMYYNIITTGALGLVNLYPRWWKL